MVDSPDSPKRKALLLGLGLDGADGHVRVTCGENFRLLGGSEQTHQRMQEVAIKINEKLSSRGKRLEDLSGQEIKDIAQDAGA
jgi:hypothetical protein